MGQYFLIVDIDKREYLDPHKFGDGVKLMEFGCSASGTMTALALLLRQSDAVAGGDFQQVDDYPIVGSWAGNRITIVGDYDSSGLYEEADTEYKDVSLAVMRAMGANKYLLKEMIGKITYGWDSPNYLAMKELGFVE